MLGAAYFWDTLRRLKVGTPGSILSACCCEGAQVRDFDFNSRGLLAFQFPFHFVIVISLLQNTWVVLWVCPWKEFQCVEKSQHCYTPPSAKFQPQQICVWQYALYIRTVIWAWLVDCFKCWSKGWFEMVGWLHTWANYKQTLAMWHPICPTTVNHNKQQIFTFIICFCPSHLVNCCISCFHRTTCWIVK